MPPKIDDIAVLRIVVREGFSRDLAAMLLEDLRGTIEHFEVQPGYKSSGPPKKAEKTHKIC